jgi:hypothetical protein
MPQIVEDRKRELGTRFNSIILIHTKVMYILVGQKERYSL